MCGEKIAELLRVRLSGFSGSGLLAMSMSLNVPGFAAPEHRRVQHRHVLAASIRQSELESHSPGVFGRIGNVRVAAGYQREEMTGMGAPENSPERLEAEAAGVPTNSPAAHVPKIFRRPGCTPKVPSSQARTSTG